MLGVGLALGASLAFGVGDFIGGAKSRVLPVLVVPIAATAARARGDWLREYCSPRCRRS